MSPADHHSQRSANQPASRIHPFLICSVNGELYGLDVNDVRHIAVVGRIWRLPKLPPFVLGVTRLRNRLCLLIDVRRRFGLPDRVNQARAFAVEIDAAHPVALAVDSVEDVQYVDVDNIYSVACLREDFNCRTITGMITVADRMCMLLDLPWILTGQASQQAASATMPVTSPPVVALAGTDASPGEVSSTVATSGPHDQASDVTPAEPVAAMLSVIGVPPSPTRARTERLLGLLSKPVVVGRRRVPGFRPADPRLPALAAGLLEAPREFRTNDAAPLVAAHLNRTPEEYRLSHFRYDLAKFRARNLAERIGCTLRYRLTGIGRIACHIIAKRSAATRLPKVLTGEEYPQRAALSA